MATEEDVMDRPSAVAPSRSIGRNIAALTGGQFITWAMTLLWTFIVPRELGPSEMGLIVSGWAVAGVLGIVLGLGTKNYLVRELVVDQRQGPSLLASALLLRLVMVPFFVVTVVVYTRYAHYSHAGTVVVYLASAATFFVLLSEPLQAVFQAFERMEYLAYSEVISKSAQGLVGVLLALAGIGSVGITGVWMASVAVVFVLNAWWLGQFMRLRWRGAARLIGRLVRGSLAYWAFGLFFMLYLWIDSLMLSLMTRPEVVAWYGVPTKLFQTLMFLPVIIATAWLPRLVTAYGEGPDRLQEESRKPFEWVVLFGVPLAAGTVIVARPLVELLYGKAYAPSVPVLMILGLCIPFMYLNIIISQILIAADRQVVWTWVMAGATLLNPLLNAGLITVTDHAYGNGAIGAAIALLLTEVVIVVVGFVVVGRRVVDAHLARRVFLVTVASTVLCAAGLGSRPLGDVPAVAIAVAAFLVTFWRLRVLSAEEVDRVRTIVAQRLKRRPAEI